MGARCMCHAPGEMPGGMRCAHLVQVAGIYGKKVIGLPMDADLMLMYYRWAAAASQMGQMGWWAEAQWAQQGAGPCAAVGLRPHATSQLGSGCLGRVGRNAVSAARNYADTTESERAVFRGWIRRLAGQGLAAPHTSHFTRCDHNAGRICCRSTTCLFPRPGLTLWRLPAR